MPNQRRAVVVYSVGGDVLYGGTRVGPANEKLAQIAANRAKEKKLPLLVEDSGAYLRALGYCPDLEAVGAWVDGKFPGTEGITKQFVDGYLRPQQIDTIDLVAHPFLHRLKCKKLLRQAGFAVEVVPTGWVPFDRECPAWWCRGPLHLLLYAILQKLTGRQGR